MKKKSKILTWGLIILVWSMGKINAQVTDSTETDTTSWSKSIGNATAPETVTLADTINLNSMPEAGNVTSHYQATEVIRIYSGKHDGDNLIRTIEVPLPEVKQNEQRAYIPR